MNEIRPGLSVRSAAAADLGEILAIERSWPTTPRWNREQFEAELSSERSLLCVLEEGNRIRGYAAMKLVPPEAQIFNVAVHPEASGRGFGGILMGYLHDEARARDCAKCVLEVSERNAAAIRLYSRFGYRIVGRRPKYYNDGATALLMEAPL